MSYLSPEVGDTLTVRITRIHPEHGVFVMTPNGHDGLIRPRDIAWNNQARIIAALTEGDMFEAQVINILPDGKLSFSRRVLLPNPESLEIGSTVTGVVDEILDYLLLVRFDGFVAVASKKELSSSFYRVGDEITTVIIDKMVDEKGRTNIKLSVMPFHKYYAQHHSQGDHVSAYYVRRGKANDSSFAVVSVDSLFLLDIPEHKLIDPVKSSFEYGILKTGEELEFVFVGNSENKGIVLLDMRPIRREREQEKIRQLRSQLSEGDVLNAEVKKVWNKEALIQIEGTDVTLPISRDELSPNKVIRASDEVFVGERIKVAFIGDGEDGSLQLSRRFFVKDKYDEKLYDLSLEELLKTMDIQTTRFVGKAITINGSYFFSELMTITDSYSAEDGKLLVDPVNGKSLLVILGNRLRNFVEEGQYYVVDIDLADKERRLEEGTPYLFHVARPTIKPVRNPYKETVLLSFKQHTSPNTNAGMARLLGEVGQNLYTSKKRMFFELLQNADDAAPTNGVKVKLQLDGEYFILTHDGYAFNKHDFTSITSAARSTKSSNKKKTGYKGIGFKSVFTNSNSVFIKSGGFDFAFDKNLEIYNHFEKFYFLANEIKDDPLRQEAFLRKYAPFRANFNGVKDIPWQLLPVWTDGPAIEAKDSIFYQKENVAIALHMDRGTLSEYDKAIDEVFSEPRFMLFLRNTNRIQLIRGNSYLTIQKNLSDDGKFVSLVNSFKEDKQSENFRVYSLEKLEVNDEAFAAAGVLIKRKERINSRGDKENYFVKVDAQGVELSEVPEIPDRITSAVDTSISLAILLDDNGRIQMIDKNELSFYAFLPMNEHRFKFPFFINADFIPKSDREGVQSDNPWNYFLFYHIGRAIVSMVAENASADEKEYLNLLPVRELETSSQDTSLLADAFNRGYSEALASSKFILNDQSTVVGSCEIVMDESKLAEYIGYDGYYNIVGTKKRLPNAAIESKVLSNAIFGIERTTVASVVETIKNNPDRILSWIKSTTDVKRQRFYNWLTKDRTSLPLTTTVPSLKFGDAWLSYETAIKKEKCILTTNKLAPIKGLLAKLGFTCSETILDDHPLKDYLKKQVEKTVFEAIVSSDISILSFPERLSLFKCANKLEGVGVETIGKWPLFKNAFDQYTPLSKMFAFNSSCPEWLKGYMIHSEESHEYLLTKLVADNSVYSSIIEPFIDEILTKIDVLTLYRRFSQSWRQAFTANLITKGIPGILAVVEQSDLKTKETFVKNQTSFALSSHAHYDIDSIGYRTIKIAVEAGTEAINHIRSITSIDGVKMLDVTLKDEFSVVFLNKKYPFSLSKVLPTYSSSSNLSIVANKFATISGYEKVFAQNEADSLSVWKQLFIYLSRSRGTVLNSEQFCFMMMYRRSQGCSSFDGQTSQLIVLNDAAFKDVLDRCLSGDMGDVLGLFLKDSYIKYPCGRVVGKFIDSDDYTLQSERVPTVITSWADTKEKKDFLSKLGIHDSDSQEILRRASFKKNLSESIWNITDKSIINAFLTWVKESFVLPIVADNQVKILEGLFQTVQGTKLYYSDDFVEAKEFSNEQYLKWKQNRDFTIYCLEGAMPYRGYIGDTCLYKGRTGDFVFFPELKRLYITSDRQPEAVLADVYPVVVIPFTKDDWNSLFLVSTSVLRELEKENARLRRQRDEYYKLFMKENDTEVDEHGKYTEKDNIDERTRIEINRDARIAAKEFLDCLADYDCSEWDPEVGTHLIKNVIKFRGKSIVVAVLSSRSRKLYLHPRAFADLMEDPDNLLLNYGYDNKIHPLSFEDIFKDNPNVNLIFDTDVVNPKEIAGLANKYMHSRKTCFVVENPRYSQSDVIKSFGLNEKKQGGMVLTDLSDDDIFGFEEE